MTDFRRLWRTTSRDEEELRLTMETGFKPGARIKVVGVGGGGSNAVNRMVTAGLDSIRSSSNC